MCNSLLGRPEVKEKATTYAFVRCNWLVFLLLCVRVVVMFNCFRSRPFLLPTPSSGHLTLPLCVVLGRESETGHKSFAFCRLASVAPPPTLSPSCKRRNRRITSQPQPPTASGGLRKKPSVPYHDREQNPYGKSIHSLFFVWHTHTHGLTVRDFLFHTLSQPDNGNKHGTGTAVSWRRRRWHWWFCSKLELYHCFTAHMHRHTHVQTHIHTLETGTGVEIDCFCCVRLRLLYCWAAGKLAAFPL